MCPLLVELVLLAVCSLLMKLALLCALPAGIFISVPPAAVIALIRSPADRVGIAECAPECAHC